MLFKCEDEKLALGYLGMLISLVQNKELDGSCRIPFYFYVFGDKNVFF